MKERLQKILSPYLYGSAYSRALFTIWGLAFKEFKAAFYQFFTIYDPLFSMFRLLKYAFLALIRIPLGRSLRMSYAYTGEDRIIESLIKPIITKDGFYVDVGCNDPVFISNSFLFYKRGWRGICIDPNEHLIKKFKRIRPRDKAVCALVSNTESEVDFFQFSNSVLSSMNEEHVNKEQESGARVKKVVKMKTTTLTRILDEYKAPSEFDFLSIDAEENDFSVLKSLNLEKYCPRLIILEDESFEPAYPEKNQIFEYLIARGYKLEGYILKNLYFTLKKD